MSTRLNGTGRNNAEFSDMSLQHPSSSLSGRLPSWSSIWDLIKAQFGLDTRPESKQHIALQEYHIRMRLEGDEQLHSPPSARGRSKPGTNASSEDEFEEGDSVKEEQEIREGIGRMIVGVLLRVLEQDAVLKNRKSFSSARRQFDLICVKIFNEILNNIYSVKNLVLLPSCSATSAVYVCTINPASPECGFPDCGTCLYPKIPRAVNSTPIRNTHVNNRNWTRRLNHYWIGHINRFTACGALAFE